MALRAINPLPALYESDETAWLEATADLIRQGRLDELDYPHLGEFLDDMAGRDRREVKSRLVVLLAQVLKWVYQPDRRSKSWRLTVMEQQREFRGIFESMTLRSHSEVVLPAAYADAIDRASIETDLPVEVFPVECPYSIDDLERPNLLAE